MAISPRVPEWARSARKEQWRADRAAAETVRTAFPTLERIRVELVFEDADGPPPAAQLHMMHPPARAFFEFPCPYADCSGTFDLSSVVRLAMKRPGLQATGKLECAGARSHQGLTKSGCGVQVGYTIAGELQAPAEKRK
jgi:hypothetical protein